MIEEFDLNELLQIGSGLFALLLFALSLLAYHRSKQSRLLLVSASFFLYFFKLIMDHIDFLLPNIENSFLDLILSGIDFVILLLFFLAVVKK